MCLPQRHIAGAQLEEQSFSANTTMSLVLKTRPWLPVALQMKSTAHSLTPADSLPQNSPNPSLQEKEGLWPKLRVGNSKGITIPLPFHLLL